MLAFYIATKALVGKLPAITEGWIQFWISFLLQQTGIHESILDEKRSIVIGVEIKKLNVDDIQAALLDMKYTFFYKSEDLPKVKTT